jgi:hypothetical protein
MAGNLIFEFMSGTGHAQLGYPTDLLNRISTGILEIPTAIDRAWETGRSATFKIKHQTTEILGALACPQERNPCARSNCINPQPTIGLC